MVLQGIRSLISGFKQVPQKHFHTGQICTTMSLFFLCCNTKTVISKIRLKIPYVLKKLLVKTTIVSTSIYLESYSKIRNKSI